MCLQEMKNQFELNFVSAHWQSAAYFYSQFSKQKIIIMIMISLLWWSIKLWNVPEIQSKLIEALIKHALSCSLTDNFQNFLWNLSKRRKLTDSNLKAFFADQFFYKNFPLYFFWVTISHTQLSFFSKYQTYHKKPASVIFYFAQNYFWWGSFHRNQNINPILGDATPVIFKSDKMNPYLIDFKSVLQNLIFERVKNKIISLS